MALSTELLLLIGSFLFFVSMVVGKAGHKFGVPVLLLFLITKLTKLTKNSMNYWLKTVLHLKYI